MQQSGHAAGRVILCADDYAIAAGVSRGIAELAALRRISAVSALVTLPRWRDDAAALRAVRAQVSIGLHLNLTLGRPLGPMSNLAVRGELPGVGELIKAALLRRLDRIEIEGEVRRQLETFERALGFPPDHLDGHQHAHVLPQVRQAVIGVLTGDRRWRGVLVRDPANAALPILRHGGATLKTIGVAALAAGFGSLARRRGLRTNCGFSGFSAFDTGRPYADELAAAMSGKGLGHLVMCHPGYADAELAELDPVTLRRTQELETLLELPGLPDRIWHAARAAEGPSIDWSGACADAG